MSERSLITIRLYGDTHLHTYAAVPVAAGALCAPVELSSREGVSNMGAQADELAGGGNG